MRRAAANATPGSVMGVREWGMLLLLSILWGGSFFFVGVAVRELPPLTLVLVRLAIASATLIASVQLLGLRVPTDRKTCLFFLLMGLLNNVVPFSLFAWAQHHIPSGLASILNSTTPLFTVLLAHVMTANERLTAGKLTGVIIGLAGVTVMVGPAAFRDAGISVLAQFAGLAAAVLYAFGSIFGRRFSELGIPPIAAATGQLTASALVLLPFAL